MNYWKVKYLLKIICTFCSRRCQKLISKLTKSTNYCLWTWKESMFPWSPRPHVLFGKLVTIIIIWSLQKLTVGYGSLPFKQALCKSIRCKSFPANSLILSATLLWGRRRCGITIAIHHPSICRAIWPAPSHYHFPTVWMTLLTFMSLLCDLTQMCLFTNARIRSIDYWVIFLLRYASDIVLWHTTYTFLQFTPSKIIWIGTEDSFSILCKYFTSYSLSWSDPCDDHDPLWSEFPLCHRQTLVPYSQNLPPGSLARIP